MTFKLSTEQNVVISSKDPIICILACAGSGKTTTITRRIARLINEEEINPSSVAAITFTVLAANKLYVEIAKLLNAKSDSSQMYIGTIHSFCFHELTKGKIIESEAYEPITESQQFVLLHKYWGSWGLDKLNSASGKSKTIEKLIATFEVIKMNDIDGMLLQNKHADVYNAYQFYNNYLTENGYMDFADMLITFKNSLQDPDFAKNIINKYRYFFVDEYQDVDLIQADIVNTLKKNSNVCVVGDDDQAIYQFRGTDEKNIQDFANSKECTVHKLSENRRSPENILQAAEKVILKVNTRLPKSMTATTKNGMVSVHCFDHVSDEADYVAKEIDKLLETNQIDDYGQVAVLLRSVSSYGMIYIDSLRHRDIPYIARGAKSLFDTTELKKFMCVLKWLASEDESIEMLELLTPLLSKPFEPSVFNENEFNVLTGSDFANQCYTSSDYEITQQLHQLQERYMRRKFANLLELAHDILEILDLFSPSNALSSKLNLGYLTHIIADYEKIQDNKSFRTLYNYLNVYAQNSFDEKSTPDQVAGSVNILTVHQSKGLEYDYVFLPMVVEKRFPLESSPTKWLIKKDLFDSKHYETSIDNERRLFYVALTRARKGIYLISSKDVGLSKEKQPSRFFKEVMNTKFKKPNIIPARENLELSHQENLATSYSALEYYLTCPYRYYLNIELDIKFPQLIFFQFGKLIHDILAKINRAFINNEIFTIDDAKDYLENNFLLYYKNTNMRQYDIRKQKLKALSIIDSYYDNKYGWLTASVFAEEDFLYVSDRALVRGRFDSIIKNDSGNYTLIDYKTGQLHYGLSSEFQMQFYALTASTQLNISVSEAILYYIEEDNPIVYEVTPSFIKDAQRKLDSIIDGIYGKKYQPKPVKEICAHCEGKKICPYKK